MNEPTNERAIRVTGHSRRALWRPLLATGVVALAAQFALAPSCGGDGTGDGGDLAAGSIGYAEDIQPLVASNCVSCHSSTGLKEEGVALDTKELVYKYKAKVASEVIQKSMPQGNPLSDADIAKFDRWAQDNYPEARAAAK